MIYAETPLGTALELMHRFGFWPVAIRPGSKIPIGWSKAPARPTDESLKAVYASYPGAGVGLLLGPAGGVIDVECDGPAGPDSLIRLLGGRPIPTMGWSSARGPHHLFRYDGRLVRHDKTVLMLPDLPGLELRIGGFDGPLQSNCPPTCGDDGKPRQWNECEYVARLPDAAFRFLDEHESMGYQEFSYASSNFVDPAVKEINDAWFRLWPETQERLADLVREQLLEAAV